MADDIATLKSQIQNVNEELAKTVDNSERTINDCLGKIQNLEDELSKCRTELAARNQTIDQLKTDVQCLEDKLSSLEARLAQAVAEAEATVAHKDVCINNLEAKASALKEEILGAEREKAEMKEKIESLQLEIQVIIGSCFLLSSQKLTNKSKNCIDIS